MDETLFSHANLPSRVSHGCHCSTVTMTSSKSEGSAGLSILRRSRSRSFSSSTHPVVSSVSGLISCAFLTAALFHSPAHGLEAYADEIVIYNRHDGWIFSPSFYFQCAGEKKKFLTGVTNTFTVYNFSKNESWQPLAVLDEVKCKRCGLYEADDLTSDDILEEWELCPLDFSRRTGLLNVYKHGEFNLTLVCTGCPFRPQHTFSSNTSSQGTNLLVLLLSVVSFGLGCALFIGVITYLKQKQSWPFRDGRASEQDGVAFMQVFDMDLDEEFSAEDEIVDDFGQSPVVKPA
eukprot:TRINITY_DN2007_c0_g1_i1.p1 TRINITY_DN2007_c0_g1~~TRINITY_DN2007_c0_g1_i1.p1  ORF type:complete len:290 (-),score=56.91 TRINITY_DN2007_c0_g1_i1:63-932(-)